MKGKYWILAAFAALLIGIRIFVPDAAQRVKSVFSGGGSISDAVTALGRDLSGDDTQIYAADASRSGDSLPVDTKLQNTGAAEDFVLSDMVESNISGFLDSSQTFTPSDEQLSKREAFLSAQSAYSAYAVPAGVSYEVPCIPFEHTVPADAAVSAAFGYRVHPIYGDVRFHYGADYALAEGGSICAFADGTVVAAERYNGYGLTVILDHGGDWTSLYAHCSRLLVCVGQSVSAGQEIALAGRSGDATGPHLHFEVECSGVRYNPELCF